MCYPLCLKLTERDTYDALNSDDDGDIAATRSSHTGRR